MTDIGANFKEVKKLTKWCGLVANVDVYVEKNKMIGWLNKLIKHNR